MQIHESIYINSVYHNNIMPVVYVAAVRASTYLYNVFEVVSFNVSGAQ